MPPKRACDLCITRKVKCSGSWPCDTCRDAVKRVSCTYLTPPRKRGPKVRRAAKVTHDLEERVVNLDIPGNQQYTLESYTAAYHDGLPGLPLADPGGSRCTSKAMLAPIVRLYQQYSYNVWPVVNADILLQRLEDVDPENTTHEAENIACLATALCAATMAQLHLAPVVDGVFMTDSTTMAQACLRIRGLCDKHREHLDISSLLVSFFLHVYHAKVDQRTSAMMYIQEAISGARILRLDESTELDGIESDVDGLIANKSLVFPLLWVSER
ncbi:hypothetical protein N7486_006426 [Penicillium sp. IBT 16267x]|nr:hypothetical protein N7486_006426 [Penicillium sp. IBT 16267x]